MDMVERIFQKELKMEFLDKAESAAWQRYNVMTDSDRLV